MWKDQKCTKMNHYASIYGHITLLLQPLVFLLAGLYLSTFSIPIYILIFLILISTLLFIECLVQNFKNKKLLCSKKKKSGYLEWEFANGTVDDWPLYLSIIYMIFMIMPWAFFKNKILGILCLILLLGSLFISGFKQGDNLLKQWESKWCFQTVYLPLIFIILKYFKI